jgi:hypothetical protein
MKPTQQPLTADAVAPHGNPSLPLQTDIPFVRTLKMSQWTPLAPLQGYQGCIALVGAPPTALGDRMQVVLYVDKQQGVADPATGKLIPGHGSGVTWAPPDGAVVIDVPIGFAINDGDAILYWLNRTPPGGKPGTTGSVGGHP